MKVCLFFGSFNPIHIGHLIVGQTLLNQTDIRQLWLVVSPQNPFKQKKNLLNEHERYYMAELATADNDYIRPSNVEFLLPRPSYTIDTLTHLFAKYPSYQFSLLMGEDNLQFLHNWKNAAAIVKNYPIYVYPRPGAGPADPSLSISNLHRIDAPRIDISATHLRTLIKASKSIRYLTPDPVVEYIEKHRLYR